VKGLRSLENTRKNKTPRVVSRGCV
jgi:hypothetical protein